MSSIFISETNGEQASRFENEKENMSLKPAFHHSFSVNSSRPLSMLLDSSPPSMDRGIHRQVGLISFSVGCL